MKWMPRIVSLLVLAFYLSLWLFNEDVRSRPTLAVIFSGLLTIVLLASWRWEKAAGLLTVIGATAFFLVVTVGAIVVNDMQPLAALLGGLLFALPYVLAGGLFYMVGREAEGAQRGRAEHRPSEP